ncbi:flagellar hook-basal body complex protein FliE [Erythrobacteraceae bacterium CFH 75059]|uniref:flagellar hook-basal body complex protein FliE n=1 Tax=Qipengyuania thermophila TaxID=2509361 RepID=UPI0010217D86|nr:flagellar hook-basal body complex protein FliE [Qipengyuania thermophila]TCD06311.1 flagellar hook-basal body complex protein FliE [Erythrobacteraceae bacterium CFH 75059]
MSAAAIGGAGSSVREVLDLRRQLIERSEALRGMQAATAAPAPSPNPAGAGFADLLDTAVQSVSAVQARAADVAAAYERGEVTDIAQVMLARQEAGLAFETTLQVRNKLLSAYQDIMRLGV